MNPGNTATRNCSNCGKPHHCTRREAKKKTWVCVECRARRWSEAGLLEAEEIDDGDGSVKRGPIPDDPTEEEIAERAEEIKVRAVAELERS